MIKMFIAFLFIFGFFAVGIRLFENMSNSEKISLTKTIGYSILCSVAAMVVVTGIVLIF